VAHPDARDVGDVVGHSLRLVTPAFLGGSSTRAHDEVMARYTVVVGIGSTDVTSVKVRAGSHCAAYQSVWSRRLLPADAGDVSWARVYRRRLGVKRRRDFVSFSGGSRPDDGGTAGVREPRRPLPAPPHLSVRLDEP
jgi:hypothetical protein